MFTVHATTIAIDSRGILLRGPSGSGKSDLALRLINSGAELVADDRTALTTDKGTLYAEAPPILAGLLEVRGIGIVNLPHRKRVPVALLADLSNPDEVPRLPEPGQETVAGVNLPRVKIAPFEASAELKLQLALKHGVVSTP